MSVSDTHASSIVTLLIIFVLGSIYPYHMTYPGSETQVPKIHCDAPAM